MQSCVRWAVGLVEKRGVPLKLDRHTQTHVYSLAAYTTRVQLFLLLIVHLISVTKSQIEHSSIFFVLHTNVVHLL